MNTMYGSTKILINCDVKSLEIVVAAMLSGDKVLQKEIIDREDIHENNRLKFGLPSRLIAKVFVFRLIYGGSAYSYANDIQFKVEGKITVPVLMCILLTPSNSFPW